MSIVIQFVHLRALTEYLVASYGPRPLEGVDRNLRKSHSNDSPLSILMEEVLRNPSLHVYLISLSLLAFVFALKDIFVIDDEPV